MLQFLFSLYLSFQSAAELLCCQPDIACYAKLMTGGIIPLAATLASESVFDAFFGDSKVSLTNYSLLSSLHCKHILTKPTSKCKHIIRLLNSHYLFICFISAQGSFTWPLLHCTCSGLYSCC